jgi:transcriptional regulator with XRE-family HTH domain
MTQARLAAESGLTQAAVSGIERGRRDLSVRTLLRMAAALRIRPGALLESDPPRPALTRHQVDEVSRAVVSGDRALPRDLRLLADACASAMLPTLEACRCPGAAPARRRGGRSFETAVNRYGRGQVDSILERVDRFAGAVAP